MTKTLLLPTLLLLLLGSFCFWLTAAPPAKNSITFASADDIKTLDPGKMSWQNDIRAAMALWEGLASYDPKTLAPIPAVAQSWSISPDGLTYTFHLRPTARWSNNDPVTAADFLFAWQRNLEPATAADYVAMLFHIQGAEAYNTALSQNQPASFSSVAVESPDPLTLIIRLNAPCTYFLDLVAFPPFYPLHAKAMQPFLLHNDPAQGYDAAWTRPPHLITNGPFKLTLWQFKQQLLLEPNPYYWDRSAVQANLIRMVSYEDANAAYLAYQTHTIDIMSWVPQTFGPDLLAQARLGTASVSEPASHPNNITPPHPQPSSDVHFRPVFGTYYFVFNCQKKPFDDPRIRRALTQAIDKNQIVQSITRMGQLPINVIVPPNAIPGYSSPAGLPMDIPAAQKLLADAGYPNGENFPIIELLYNTEGIHDKIAQALGQMWQKNLNLRVSYRGLERSTFGTERRSHDFTLARGGWYGDYVDPTTWLDLLRTNNGNNDGQYSNPAYDNLMQKADAEPTPAKRFALLTQAETILTEQDLPLLPLYQYSDGYIFNPQTIQGLDMNVRLLTQFKYLHRAPPASSGTGVPPVSPPTLTSLSTFSPFPPSPMENGKWKMENPPTLLTASPQPLAPAGGPP